MIADRILDYLGDGERIQMDNQLIADASEGMVRTMRRNCGPDERSRPRKIGGSLAWYCPRRAWLSLQGAQGKPPSGRSLMAFMLGDIIESQVIALARVAAPELMIEPPNGWTSQFRLQTEINGVPFSGSIDGLVRPSSPVVYDVKSMADWGFKSFLKAARGKDDEWEKKERWGYLAQLRIYMHVAKLVGVTDQDERGFILAVNKNTGHIAELWIEQDQETIDMIYRAMPELASATEMPDRAKFAKVEKFANRLLPDGSNGKGEEVVTSGDPHWRCGYCPYISTHCYPDFEVVPMSGGPKFRKAV